MFENNNGNTYKSQIIIINPVKQISFTIDSELHLANLMLQKAGNHLHRALSRVIYPYQNLLQETIPYLIC